MLEVNQADLKLTARRLYLFLGKRTRYPGDHCRGGRTSCKRGKDCNWSKAITKNKKSYFCKWQPKARAGKVLYKEKDNIYLGQDQMEIQGQVKAEFQIPRRQFEVRSHLVI